MKTDSLFYRLFQKRPIMALGLTELTASADAGYALRAEEIKETGFRLDGVLVPAKTHPTAPFVFIEAQMRRDVEFWQRWFGSIMVFLRRQSPLRPWRALVIFGKASHDPGMQEAYRPLLEHPWVRRVYLDELARQPATTLDQQLLQLIAAKPAVAVTQARTLLLTQRAQVAPLDWPDLVDLVETILVYKLPRKTREEILKMLGFADVELKQTRFYQDVFAEGRQEGRQEGQQELVLRLLRRRLGTLGTAQVEQIETLSPTELAALADALLDFRSADELTAWLAQQQ
jgi:predicted transposase/invertase (TIGR01784 family)